MIRRRSRIILVVLVVAFVHTICFRVLKYDSNSIFDINFFGLREHLNKEAVDQKQKQDTFYTKTTELLAESNLENYNHDNKKIENRNKYLLDLANIDEYSKITLDRYLLGGNKHEIPHLQNFDPRFTFVIMFDKLTKLIAEKKTINDLKFSYFHWADWIDLSPLNEYFYSKNKESCNMFDLTEKNSRSKQAADYYKPEVFCIDDNNIKNFLKKDISKEMKKYLKEVKKSSISTGFHVFQYPGRSTSKIKSLAAKSYLNDFMPPPYSILFLLPTNGKDNMVKKSILKVNINQDVSYRKRLIHTDLVSSFSKDRTNGEEKITLDLSTELNGLLEAIKLYNSPTSKLPFTKVLKKEQFLEKSTEIISEIKNNKEASIMDKKYLESIYYSKDIKSPPKYFFEARLTNKEKNSPYGSHYDWRFFNGLINNTEKQALSLFGLIKTWLAFTNANDFDTWIAHGSLLSWYWSGIAFPWDNDIDVQMPIDQLHRLAREFNQSIIVDLGNANGEELRYGRYFLDISTFIDKRTKGNGNNNIDARFIDMDTGFYIDITGLALSDSSPPLRYRTSEDLKSGSNELGTEHFNNEKQLYNCKNSHFSKLSELSPLKMTYYEGELAYIPNDFRQILVNEYNEKGIQREVFQEYTFLKKLRLWVLRRVLNEFRQKKKNQSNERLINISVEDLSDEDYTQFLKDNEELFYEYMLTSNLTSFHEDEIYKLSRNENTSTLLQTMSDSFQTSLRHDSFTFIHLSKGYAFEDQISKVIELEKEFNNS